jgi:hypothetical protein
MGSAGQDSQSYRILVAVETDAARYYGAQASRPAVLAPADAEQMLAHLAADLQSLLPAVRHCSLVAAGALFDQTQILRPAYPVYAALEAATGRGGAHAKGPALVSIGARDGRMPDTDLQPLADMPLGPLQILPIVVQGPREYMADLAEAMEYRFLEKGQLSAHSANWLQSAFDVTLRHAQLMTLTDLNALLRLQLENHGFLALWELLDAALSAADEPLNVTTSGGHPWQWRNGAAHTVFETFDYWASAGSGSQLPAERLALAEGYAGWTRELRQYLTTLRAHALDVQLHLPGQDQAVSETFLSERSDAAAEPDACVVTEHGFDDLGTIAITLVRDGRIENLYPLRPRGLNDVHAFLRDLVPGGHTVAFPRTILYDEDTRRLRPDTSCVPDDPGSRRIDS